MSAPYALIYRLYRSIDCVMKYVLNLSQFLHICKPVNERTGNTHRQKYTWQYTVKHTHNTLTSLSDICNLAKSYTNTMASQLNSVVEEAVSNDFKPCKIFCMLLTYLLLTFFRFLQKPIASTAILLYPVPLLHTHTFLQLAPPNPLLLLLQSLPPPPSKVTPSSV